MKNILYIFILTIIHLQIQPFDKTSREEKIQFINEYIAPCLKKKSSKRLYDKILEKYYGIKINKTKKYSDIEVKLHIKMPEIEKTMSECELYLFDQKINLLLEESNYFKNKISNESIEIICILSFILQSIIPKTSLQFDFEAKNNAFKEILELNEFLFNKISIEIKNKIYEKFIKIIKKNKKYLTTMAKYKNMEDILNTKNQNLQKNFNKICREIPKIKSIEKDFLEFIQLKDSINQSIHFILNNETLYKISIFYVIFSEKNLKKLHIDTNKKTICKEIYIICELILKNLQRIFGTKYEKLKTIEAKNLNPHVIENIIRNIAFFGSADKLLGCHFNNAYFNELNNLIKQ
jgi:hypothetical protein